MCFDPISLAATVGTFFGGGTAAAGAAAGWGALGTAATIGSSVLGAYTAVQSGKATQAAAMATAKQQEQAAEQALDAGEREVDLLRRRAGQQRGANRVAMAASGVDVNSATALDLLKNFDDQVNEDAYQISLQSTRTANTYGQQAANSRAEGRSAASAGNWGAGSSLLQGAAKVGERWRPYVYNNRVKAQGGY